MPLTNDEAHELARRGPGRIAYVVVRLLLMPLLRLVFTMRVTGVENVPAEGPVVIAPNHKSFWDSFFLAAVVRRRVHFMGKAELFTGWRGRLFLMLGGFPVLRGRPAAPECRDP